jgi:hypothetical protein
MDGRQACRGLETDRVTIELLVLILIFVQNNRRRGRRGEGRGGTLFETSGEAEYLVGAVSIAARRALLSFPFS